MATEWETQLDKYTKVVAGWRASEVGGSTENPGQHLAARRADGRHLRQRCKQA